MSILASIMYLHSLFKMFILLNVKDYTSCILRNQHKESHIM